MEGVEEATEETEAVLAAITVEVGAPLLVQGATELSKKKKDKDKQHTFEQNLSHTH